MSTKRDADWIQAFVHKVLIGKMLASLEMIAPGVWDFRFDAVHLNIESPWRILDQQRIRLGSCDHAQKFGLPKPVDAARNALEMLGNMPVEDVEIAPLNSDLELYFQGGFKLTVFNYSSGYEGWNISCSEGQVIAMGGGELAALGISPPEN